MSKFIKLVRQDKEILFDAAVIPLSFCKEDGGGFEPLNIGVSFGRYIQIPSGCVGTFKKELEDFLVSDSRLMTFEVVEKTDTKSVCSHA